MCVVVRRGVGGEGKGSTDVWTDRRDNGFCDLVLVTCQGGLSRVYKIEMLRRLWEESLGVFGLGKGGRIFISLIWVDLG